MQRSSEVWISPAEVPLANTAGLPKRKQGGGCHGETVRHVRASQCRSRQWQQVEYGDHWSQMNSFCWDALELSNLWTFVVSFCWAKVCEEFLLKLNVYTFNLRQVTTRVQYQVKYQVLVRALKLVSIQRHCSHHCQRIWHSYSNPICNYTTTLLYRM